MTATDSVKISVAKTLPNDVDAVGVPVGTSGSVPRVLGVSRRVLDANGFKGNVGDTMLLPKPSGPAVVAVGTGDGRLDEAGLRRAAAAFARATRGHERVATSLTAVDGVSAASALEVAAEATVLARYRYAGYHREEPTTTRLNELTLVSNLNGERAAGATSRGHARAQAALLARDLANMPPVSLTARLLAERAAEIAAADPALEIEVFELDDLVRMGCGGIIGVNKGSVEPPRMVKLTYSPRRPKRHVALVGKGVTYDSGGISLKPSDDSHAIMKMDMSGAAAVLATMSALAAMGCRNKVTGYMMCTDNMPSGSALKLGDVLTIRNGKTVEIHNTDAEGRLILADGLSLATEEKPDAIVDIATLTGACMVALGTKIAGVFGNDDALASDLCAAGDRVGEPLWQMPLAREHYRPLLDSNVADMKNVGIRYGGAITAAIFLSEFVEDIPWAHLDIAGPMNSDRDDGIWSKGATAYGTRVLIELLTN